MIADRKSKKLGIAIINYEWSLRPRSTTLQIVVDGQTVAKFTSELKGNIATIDNSTFLNLILAKFKSGSTADVLNEKGDIVARFNLSGFTKGFKGFGDCTGLTASPSKPVVSLKTQATQRNQRNSNDGEKALKFIAGVALLAIIAKNGGVSSPDFKPSLGGEDQFSTIGEEECSSDIGCGIFEACVKEPGKSRGICMQRVNERGVPTYSIPSAESIRPRSITESSCRFITDCPIGFTCDATYRMCIKR